MTHDEYVRDPSPKPSLSASIAKILLTRSPRHAWLAHPRLNPNWQPEHSEKFDIGQAAHAMLLEGADRMTAIEAADWRTNAAKEARDVARKEGKHPVLRHQYTEVCAMVAEAQAAFNANEDLNGYTLSGAGGESEHPILWHEGETYFRAKLDRVSQDRKLIIDYKTTDCAEPEVFLRQMVNLGYDLQAAMYMRALKQQAEHFVFLVQEVEAPFACSFIGMTPTFFELGERKLEAAIAIWKQCMATGEWPGYPKRVCYMDPPSWELAKWEGT